MTVKLTKVQLATISYHLAWFAEMLDAEARTEEDHADRAMYADAAFDARELGDIIDKQLKAAA